MGYNEEPTMSADTVSSLYPDRPIRPLPKRRLRERLSPEVADSIQYPPTPQTTTPLFYYPYNLREDDAEPGLGSARERNAEVDPRQTRRIGFQGESEGEGPGNRRVVLSRPAPDLATRGASNRTPPKPDPGRTPNAQLVLSTASSVDGYESLENTNNKKKRKIPSAGDVVMTGSHTIPDSGSSLALAAKNAKEPGDSASSTSVPYYTPSNLASGAQNVPGPGRGRYGRVRNGRSPLRALSDSTNNWAGRNGKLRPGQWASSAVEGENTGIISSAIANAEKHHPQPGQENISLLQQQQAAKPSPASTQFTFTCDSQVPGSLAWPGSDRRSVMGGNQNSVPKSGNENWQDKPPNAASGQQPPPAPAPAQEGAPQAGGARSGGTSQDQAAARKNQRRRERRELRDQARERERQTQLQNKLHPPNPDEAWICELCEYYAIFGERPKYLTDKYERKVQQERRLMEERKANLAKRLANPRKGAKKSSRSSANKTNNAAQNASSPQDNDSLTANASHGTQSEEYYEEDYDEEDVEEYDDDGAVDIHSSPGVDDNMTPHEPFPSYDGGGRGGDGGPGGTE